MKSLNRWRLLAWVVCVGLGGGALFGADDAGTALRAAARTGDVEGVERALAHGADVNAADEIGVTALWLAASRGHLEVVNTLVRQNADVNARDGIWYQTPLSGAVGIGNAEMVEVLLDAGANDADAALVAAAQAGNIAVIRAVLNKGKVGPETLDVALFLTPHDAAEARDALENAGASLPKPASNAEREAWLAYVGEYESDAGRKLKVEIQDGMFLARPSYGPAFVLRAGPNATFKPVAFDAVSISFERSGDGPFTANLRQFTAEVTYTRLDLQARPAPKQRASQEGATAVLAPQNWPSFRGSDAAGVADAQNPPTTWDGPEGINIRWKTPIPGLGHSCPIVWNDRVFVTTAVSGDPDPKVRIGLYGDVASVDDLTPHTWLMYCLDKHSGEIVWQRTANEGVPKIKRHLKGSQANCTPATDGRHVVACFGSEGLYCYDFDGQLLWNRDLGVLDSSFFVASEFQWGFGSSPILFEGLVVLQCDLSKDSFIAAYSLEDGRRVWTTPRDELPTWSTPTIYRGRERVELLTNGAQYARGYNPLTGKELWRLAKKSEITVPTPVVTDRLLFFTSGNRPIQPIYAIRPGAEGDISLNDGQDESPSVAWSKQRGGPYMPTPIVYGPYLYLCSNNGTVTCFEAETGKQVYKQRIGGGSYTASPIAADGKLFFTSEEGDVAVVKAGPTFELLATNPMGDICMATPAISDGMVFVRSQHFVSGIGGYVASEPAKP
ncbi:MAG TPA: PQQ-binding-like beta-propeller repeat protein [Pirellulales bacterium]|nr:PQQ-binding-like beta-propeller repeat protein [Pirellulales bacterium]